MSGEELNAPDKRRQALKKILAGTGVVTAAAATDKWIKPIVDSVVLPAHAATSGPGFSLTDPVTLTYTCSSPIAGTFIIDISGYLNAEIAGITVHLELTATVLTGTAPAPISVDVVTDANGSYSSTGHDLGYNIASVTVVASLPDYPDADEDEDTINPSNSGFMYGTYYCAAP